MAKKRPQDAPLDPSPFTVIGEVDDAFIETLAQLLVDLDEAEPGERVGREGGAKKQKSPSR